MAHAVAFALLLSTVAPAFHADSVGPLEIPHRRGWIVVDAELNDWAGPVLEARFAESELVGTQGNEVVARMTWDADALFLAIDVRDEEVVAAQAGIEDFRLAKWDCVAGAKALVHVQRVQRGH